MNRPTPISVFSDQRRTKSTTWSRTSCGTHILVRAPQNFFLRRCARPSARPTPRPSSGSSFPETRFASARLCAPDGSWTGRPQRHSRRTLLANGRIPLAAAPTPHIGQTPTLCRASAVLGWLLSLPLCSAFVFFACVLSVILTDERSLQFQLRQHTSIDSMQKGLSVVINTNSCLFSSRYRFKISQCTVPDFGYSLSASKSSAVTTGTFRLSSDVGPHHPQTRTPPGRADGSQQIEQFEP